MDNTLAGNKAAESEEGNAKKEEEASKKLLEIEEKEKSLLDKITEKYGRGSLNPETGVFTPEKS